jgi:vacuolar-type H+-ATPase subunit E/Vma4
MTDKFFSLEDDGDCGGVILFSANRKIKCINTINSRLMLCFEEILPDIRRILFPKRNV